MRLRIIRAAVWTVLAPVDARGHCRVREVMDALERTDKAAHDQVVALLDRVSRHGPPLDLCKSRPLDDAIYEFKTARGWRLVYFYDGGRLVICAELLRKPKARELSLTVRRARRVRHEYLVARAADAVLIEESR